MNSLTGQKTTTGLRKEPVENFALPRHNDADKTDNDASQSKELETKLDLNKDKDIEQLSLENSLSKNETLTDQNSTIKKQNRNSIQDYFQNGPQWFQNFRNYFVIALNTLGIGLNIFSAISSNTTFMKKEVADFFDKASVWYSKNIVSLGFAWNGIESLVGKRPIEALSRLLPPIGFLTLPFYNLNFATGISSFMSYVLDKVVKRNGNKQPGKDSAIENTKQVLLHCKDIFKDLFNSKSKETLIEKLGIAGLGLGTFGGLAFASKDRDSLLARLFGFIRNAGGLTADAELVFNNDKTWRGTHKRIVGFTCSTASILNIIARFVDDKLGRTLNHIAIGLDDLGLTYWAHMSKKENDESMNKMPQEKTETLPYSKILQKQSLRDTDILHFPQAV